MAGRATYTEADRAKVYVVLSSNEGNVKRTSRETAVPENTVRRWKREFAENGPPQLEDIQQAAGDFIEDADRIRHKALLEIERKIEAGEAKVNELNNTVGILTDKIDRAKGLSLGTVEHKHTLPSPDEIRAALGAVVAGAIEASRQRQEEIEDAEIVEQSPRELQAAPSQR